METQHLVSGALALAVLASGCSRQAGPGGDMPPMAVKMTVARQVKVDDTTEYVASIRSRRASAIMPDVEGRVTRIFVRPGQQVTAGDPLVEVDPSRQEASV